jgi:hypothetical protein
VQPYGNFTSYKKRAVKDKTAGKLCVQMYIVNSCAEERRNLEIEAALGHYAETKHKKHVSQSQTV